MDMACIQEMVELKEINIVWVKGKQKFADVLIKFGASEVLLVNVLESDLRW